MRRPTPEGFLEPSLIVVRSKQQRFNQGGWGGGRSVSETDSTGFHAWKVGLCKQLVCGLLGPLGSARTSARIFAALDRKHPQNAGNAVAQVLCYYAGKLFAAFQTNKFS